MNVAEMNIAGWCDWDIYDLLLSHHKYGPVVRQFSAAWHEDSEFTLLSYIIWSREISLAKELVNGGITLTGTDYYYLLDTSESTFAALQKHRTGTDDRFNRLLQWLEDHHKDPLANYDQIRAQFFLL